MAEFDVANLKEQRPGATQEKTLSPTGKAGVYRHRESGQEAIALWDPLLGNTQAEALMRVGFEYVRDAEDDEIKNLVTPSLQANKDQNLVKSNEDEVKGILARLNAVEAENARLREQRDKPTSQTELSQEMAKSAAVQKVAERGTDNSGDVASSGGVNAPLTPQVTAESDEEKTNDEESVKPRRGRPAKTSEENGDK